MNKESIKKKGRPKLSPGDKIVSLQLYVKKRVIDDIPNVKHVLLEFIDYIDMNKKIRHNIEIPKFIFDVLSNQKLNEELINFYPFYINNQKGFITPEEIYIWETTKDKSTLTFYLPVDISNSLYEISTSSLRNLRQQTKHFIYSYFKFIS